MKGMSSVVVPVASVELYSILYWPTWSEVRFATSPGVSTSPGEIGPTMSTQEPLMSFCRVACG